MTGVREHVLPASDGAGVITRKSSDAFFGTEGLGFRDSRWMVLISSLARNGISAQTGSRPDETDVEGCALGWGQGAFSSHVFEAKRGVDQERLAALTTHLVELARRLGDADGRITAKVLAAFVSSQDSQPFSTAHGVQSAKTLRERLSARFRGHIQWQALYLLCGQIGIDGTKQVTPELLKQFFLSDTPFFEAFIERRRLLRTGSLQPGSTDGPLGEVSAAIDRGRTDEEYMRTKSGFLLLARIAVFMLKAAFVRSTEAFSKTY